LNIDSCLECDQPAVPFKMVTGDELHHWCKHHMVDANDVAIEYLGLETANFIGNSDQHNIWFWAQDIQHNLSTAIIDFFTEMGRDLYRSRGIPDMRAVVDASADILRLKAKEYRGAIEFSKEQHVEVMKIMSVWLTKPYVHDIGGPLGEETKTIVSSHRDVALTPDIFHHLICMVLAAKRATSYANSEHAERLILWETTVWENHKQQLGN